jgi:hypothetical protein
MANCYVKYWGMVFCSIAMMASGCASHKFMPAAYSVPGPQTNYRTKFAAAKKVVLCTPFDRISKGEHATYDQRFNPSVYVQVMFEREFAAANVPFSSATFGYGSSFEDVAEVLAKSPVVSDDSVVLASAILWFPDAMHMSCDVKVFSHSGVLLFEKRGICLNGPLLVPFDASRSNESARLVNIFTAQSVMQQIFNDPDFQKALK